METPFHRDVIKELCEAARRHGLKIDFYFSHPDWYDADFRPYNFHPLQTPGAAELAPNETYLRHLHRPSVVVVPDPSPEETGRMVARHRAQIRELLTNYGKIDMMCLDQWFGPKVWPELKQTIKMIRELQPDVMLRARGIGNYGDYYTPEEFVPEAKANTNMPWFVIYPLADGRFSYEADGSKYKGARWIVRSVVDTVAKGGNFMVGIGPDGNGRFHPAAIAQLREAGCWLKANAEAIYPACPREGDLWKEGDAIRYTRTPDGRAVYAFSLDWPGEHLTLRTVKPAPGARITLVGRKEPLAWQQTDEGLVITMPSSLRPTDTLVCAFHIPLE
jgi:alpha-L-fucosidase